MPFLLAEILNFQGSTHRIGVGSFSYSLHNFLFSLTYSGYKHILVIVAGIPVIENIVRSPLAAYK